jgi:hypothetical protein
MTIVEYARHRGVSKTAVTRAVQLGRISTTGKPKRVDPAEADRQWAANTDTTKALNSVNGTPRKGGLRGKETMNFNSARAVHETYKARKAKLEFEQLRGKLIDAEEVRKKWFTICRMTRDKLMSVPDRVVPMIAGMVDSAEMHRLVAAEIRQALEEMSGEPD